MQRTPAEDHVRKGKAKYMKVLARIDSVTISFLSDLRASVDVDLYWNDHGVGEIKAQGDLT
jgi:hypothetical protein